MRSKLTVVCCLVLFQVATATGHAATLMGAARQVEITPPAGVVSTWGYGSAVGIMTRGTLDPLYAHVLYLKAADGTAFAWVDLDCGRTPGIPTLNRMRQDLSKIVPHVFFSATHTHSGPFFKDDKPGTALPPWEKRMVSRIENAVRDAAQHAEPVRLGFAYGSAVIGYNRRLVRADGSVTMLHGIDGNQDRIATGPIDPTYAVLRVDGKSGQPIAIVVNATAHPVIRKQHDMFSADYPGVVRKVISQGFSSHPVCLFLQGAAGDINPQRPLGDSPSADDGVKQLGDFLGRKVLATARKIAPEAGNGRIQIDADHVTVGNRWPHADFQGKFAIYRHFIGQVGAHPRLPVVTILLNRDIAWAAFPGELFIQLQMYFRVHSPLVHTLFAGYSNGYFGYFPTIEAASAGGYGANNIMTSVSVGAGEEIVNRALIDIDRLLGRLRTIPADSPYGSTWKRE